MCGIVGYVGAREATEVVVTGLQRLEYRGYDSAGIAILNGGDFQVRRSVGKLTNLQQRLSVEPTHGRQGIGHTRWATHGGVTEANAHPHRSDSGDIVVIQNGIFENYLEQKGYLIEAGVTFHSQTDTEVIAHLIERETKATGDFTSGFRQAMQQLRGGNAVVAMHRSQPGLILAARIGNAGGVVIGLGENENFVASDIPAILDYTQQVLFLEDGEIAIVTSEQVRIETLAGQPVTKQPQRINWDPVAAAKGG
jgi:glutamine---fructose-6-phosphate transaminase (isomerizing)